MVPPVEIVTASRFRLETEMSDKTRYLSIAHAVRLSGLSKTAIYDAASSQKMPVEFVVFGSTRRYRIPAGRFQLWLEEEIRRAEQRIVRTKKRLDKLKESRKKMKEYRHYE